MSDKKTTVPTIEPNAPKSRVVLIEIDSISVIEDMGITLITGTDSAGKVLEFSIGSKFFEKIKGDAWCTEGTVARCVVEERIAGKTTYEDASTKEVKLHTKDGFTCNRLSKGSQSTWKRELEDKASARQQAAKAANASKALDLLSAAVDKGLSEDAAAVLIGQIMA